MSYIGRHRSDLGALGDVATVLSAAQSVVTDPCLTTVASLVGRLHTLESAPAVPGAPAPAPVKGIGLCKAVGPLEAVVWVRERPWVIPLGTMAIIGGLISIGYLIGSSPKRAGMRTTVGTKIARVNPSRRRR